MKDIHELLNDFDSIQDLPVSEEMVGAYLENNLDWSERQSMEDICHSDDRFSQLLSSLSMSNDASMSLFDDDTSHDLDNELTNNINSLNLDLMAMKQSQEDLLGAAAARKCFGEEGTGSAPNPDLLIYQGTEGVCAIRSQQIILRDYGIDVSLEELKQYAINQGWYDPSEDGGTPLNCVGALLQACGVDVRQQQDCTIYDLVNELAQGHRVIVGVDAGELWASRDGDIIQQTKEFFKDIIHEEANHALVVAGVEVNPNDPADVKVILTDPGTGDLRIEYDLDDFMDAWEDSNCFMTTTTTPAPYQYDAEHRRMVPSNFAVESFIDSNSLPVQPDILIDYPDLSLAELNENAAYPDGHLDTVGHIDGHEVDYESFAAAHKTATHLKAIGGVGAFGQEHFDKAEFVSALRNLLHIDDPDHGSGPDDGPGDDFGDGPSDDFGDGPDDDFGDGPDDSLDDDYSADDDYNDDSQDPASLFM